MTQRRLSLYKIEDAIHPPFDPAEYSVFKFGDTFYAEKFAAEMAACVIEHLGTELLEQEQICISPSPYSAIPTASNYLCKGLIKHLNSFLFTNQKPGVKEIKINRNQTYTQDYGELSYDERRQLIANDTYYLDKNQVNGQFCLFLDDIRITGSHEHTLQNLFEKEGIKGNFVFLYFAELVNFSISPKIENYYNYYAIKNTEDLIKNIHKESFRFNTRTIKYILKLTEEHFDFVYQRLSDQQKRDFFNLSISNNYHLIEEYQKNLYNLKLAEYGN